MPSTEGHGGVTCRENIPFLTPTLGCKPNTPENSPAWAGEQAGQELRLWKFQLLQGPVGLPEPWGVEGTRALPA